MVQNCWLPVAPEMPDTGTPFCSTLLVLVTVTVRCADPANPPLSVTDAVMVCVPTESDEVLKPAPLPMLPLRLDDQVRLAEMLPSSVSPAVPLKLIAVPWVTEVPLGGAVMETVGAVLPGPPPMVKPAA